MKNKDKEHIQVIGEGISAGSSIISLAVPAFATVPLIVFGVNRIIHLVSDEDVIKRLKKIETKLEEKKISKDDFKRKVENLSEHKKFFSTTSLEDILKNCIPETVDIYISLFIDYIMKEKFDVEEELCEIVASLNAHDLLLLKKIKDYLLYGNRLDFNKELKRIKEEEKEIKRRQEENTRLEKINRVIEKENKNSKDKKITYLILPPMKSRSIMLDKNRTIFWGDFSNYCKLPSQIPLNITMLSMCNNTQKKDCYSEYIFYGKSFLKLEKAGALQLESINTMGTLNSLHIDRFHITFLGEFLLNYID